MSLKFREIEQLGGFLRSLGSVGGRDLTKKSKTSVGWEGSKVVSVKGLQLILVNDLNDQQTPLMNVEVSLTPLKITEHP